MKRISDFNTFNEGVKIASRAWKGGEGEHYTKGGRNLQLKKNALLHLFRDVIGKNIGFKMKTGQQQQVPLNYVLLEVTGKDEKTYSGDSKDYLQTFNFYFWAEDGVKDYAPFAKNKQEVILEYSFKNDEFKMGDGNRLPMMNRKLANFLVKSANKLREIIITADMPEKETGVTFGDKFYAKKMPSEEGWKEYDMLRTRGSAHFEIDTEKAEELKKSRLKRSDFRCFDDNEGEFRIR